MRTNSNYFPVQHKLTAIYNRDLTLYSRIVAIYTAGLTFNNSTFCPHSCVYVFCVDMRTNSNYFPVQHKLTGIYNRDLTLYSPVVTICTAGLTFNNSTFCPHSCIYVFVWIWEQTAIISLYNLNWLVYITRFNSLQPSGHYMYRRFNIQQFYVLLTQLYLCVCVDLRTNSDYFPVQH